VTGPLPGGVVLRPLETHVDRRGAFTEIFRDEWGTGVRPIQWNAVTSSARTLRGVHVHRRHDDYLLLLQGRASIGLRDLRLDSSTAGLVALIELSGRNLQALVIPTGVAHGFYFAEPSLHVYSVTEYWHPADELGCRWDDPDLAIPWPISDPILSPRDAGLGSLSDLLATLARDTLTAAPPAG
jgi:dTDP-4-dehydrorhamnose 3,5-epimerase